MLARLFATQPMQHGLWQLAIAFHKAPSHCCATCVYSMLHRVLQHLSTTQLQVHARAMFRGLCACNTQQAGIWHAR
jgi:hypothetical protein